jgi:predicted permease
VGPLVRCKRLFAQPHLRLIALIGIIVPRQLRADWRQEWETELRYREMLLADWDRLDWRIKLDLLRRSTSAFWDALWLQRRRLEAEVFQDLRYGARLLVAHPGFTIVAVLTLSLGIGANSAIFTLLDQVLIRPVPVEQPHELVVVVEDGNGTARVVSYPLYSDLRDGNDVLVGLAAYVQRPFSLTDGVRSERVTGQLVSGNYFAVLGVRPALGRFFLSEEDRTAGTHPVAVISHGLWRRRFGADPRVIGKELSISGYRFTIIGVTPSEFTGTTRGTAPDVYLPVMMLGQAAPGDGGMLSNRNAGWLRLIGRLKSGISRQRAEAALTALTEGLQPSQARKAADGPPAKPFLLVDGSHGYLDRVQDLSLPLKLIMGVVGFVLLIACANVANLLLARASARRGEIAVRLAIGASRARIVRQLLTEGAILATVAGITSFGVAYAFTSMLLGIQQQTTTVPRFLEGRLDSRTLTFTLALSLVTAVLFSLAPALQTSKPDLVESFKKAKSAGGGWRRAGLRSMLVVTQVALSLVVLIGAGLCVKSLRTLQSIDSGLEPTKVLTASFDLRLNGYDEARGRQFLSQLSDRVSRLPGVEAVSFANIVAFSDGFWISPMSIEGYQPGPDERMAFDINRVGPDYFRTIGTPVVNGRDFTSRDTAESPRVVIVNEAAMRRYWAGKNPIGARTNRGEVVGVAKDTKEKGLRTSPRPAVYLPLLQAYVPGLSLHVRAAIEPRTLLADVRRELQTLDAALPIYNVKTLDEQQAGSLYAERLAALVLTLFASLALIVSAVGIYGVLSYGVTERTREIGIRLAHGAQPRDLLTLVVGEGMTLTAIGLAVGLAASFGLTHLLQHVLFGIGTTDPLTFAVTPILLAAVALLACWIPAMRAMRMNPLAALRHE